MKRAIHASRERARQISYPSLGDQLDAIWKHIAALPNDQVAPEARAMRDRIKAVKDRYPKPEKGEKARS